MDIYKGSIRNKTLHIPQRSNKSLKPEWELFYEVLGTDSRFLTSYFKFDGVDLLAMYSQDTFEKIWAHVLHPKPKGADFTNEEIDDIVNTRRVIFPFSEHTKIDWYKSGHVKFNEYSLKEFYGLEKASLAGKLKQDVLVVNHGNKLMVIKPESLEAFLKLDEKMNKTA
jgi:hypothetical protein